MKATSLKRKILAVKKVNEGKYLAYGSYGRYYYWKHNIGFKLINWSRHRSIKKLIQSQEWKDAADEAKCLKRASKLTKITPKFFALRILKLGIFYYPAIFMEHIQGEMLIDIVIKNNWDDEYRLYLEKTYAAKLKKIGIKHLDVHMENIIIPNSKKLAQFRIIDLGPDFISFKNKHGRFIPVRKNEELVGII